MVSFGALFNPAERDDVAKLEDWGYDSVWTSEHILFHVPTLEGLTVLAYYAARTTRLRVGTAVYLLALRHPTVVAKTVTTLDILSGGRVTLGVGVGGEYPKEFEATGVPVRQRGSRTDEALEVVRALWTGSHVTHEGRYVSFTDVTMLPRPVQQPGPPIVIAGRSEAAQRRAGRLGDGYMPYLFSVDRYARGAQVVRAAAAERGRDLGEGFTWSLYLFVALADTMEEGRRLAAEQLQLRYQQPFEQLVDAYCALGRPQDAAEKIAQFVEVGVNDIVLVPLLPAGERHVDAFERYAAELIPLLR
jgi:probable F420-dependent oxidoreductase